MLENNILVNLLVDMELNYKNNSTLMLFPSTHIVNGINRSLIQSATKCIFDIIPKEFALIIEDALSKPIIEIYQIHGIDNKSTLDSYINFLIEKGYGFISNEGIPSQSINNEHFNYWDAPFKITNAIIDYNINYDAHYKTAIEALGLLGCDIVQVRFLNNEKIEVIDEIVAAIYNTKLYSGLSLIMNNRECNITNELLESFVAKYPLITEIILYNAKDNSFKENKKYRFKILQIKNNITHHSCGAVQPFYFSLNISSYTESLHHNTCLNRKIAIDVDGNIKNCPSMKESFGNIRDTTLEEAINKPGFKKYWNITKDEISKCKDCEFRHVCTDCRAYLENPEDIYSAPLKCGYDPYTCEWEEWSTNPLKQKAIDYYGMREIINNEK